MLLTSGSFPFWDVVFFVFGGLGIVGTIVGAVVHRAWQRRGVLRMIDAKINHNQQRLKNGEISALDTSDWQANELEIAKLLRNEDYRLLEEYHHRLTTMKPTSSAEDTTTVVRLGGESQKIINKYTTGWRRFGLLPRLIDDLIPYN
jgi:hypothetical protein